jgi:hypothetical protein
MSNENVLAIERCGSLEEKYIYVNTISINYFANLENYIEDSRGLERNAYRKDIQTTWGGSYEEDWQTVYLLVRHMNSFQNDPTDKGNIVDKNTRLKEFPDDGSGPVVLFRGLNLTSDSWEKYDDWVKEWGYDVYIPLLLKVPGISGYRRWWLANIRFGGHTPKPGVTENPEYPQDLAVIYFENLKAYQNFRKSKELVAFEKNLATAFPGGLNYTWDLAFRLLRRWSR